MNLSDHPVVDAGPPLEGGVKTIDLNVDEGGQLTFIAETPDETAQAARMRRLRGDLEISRDRLLLAVSNASRLLSRAELRTKREIVTVETALVGPSALPTLNIRDLERVAIKAALVKSKGNVERAAEILGLGRATLYRRLASYERVRS